MRNILIGETFLKNTLVMNEIMLALPQNNHCHCIIHNNVVSLYIDYCGSWIAPNIPIVNCLKI